MNGHTIRAWRAYLDLRQTEVAKMAGVAQRTVAYVESDEKLLRTARVRIANVLQLEAQRRKVRLPITDDADIAA